MTSEITSHHKTSLWSLISSMVLVSVVVATTTLALIYRTAYKQELLELQDEAYTFAHLAESIAEFDALHSQHDDPQGALGATMKQLRQGLAYKDSPYATDELVLGQQIGNNLHIFAVNKQAEWINVTTVPMAQAMRLPMYQALTGNTGHGKMVDYKGHQVLAGYSYIPSLKTGIVSKIELADFHQPYLVTAAWAAGATTLITALGVLIFIRFIQPVLRQGIAAESRMTSLLQTAPVGIYETDAAGHCTYVNTQWCKLTGLSTEQALSTGWARALHPEDRAKIEAAWQTLVTAQQPFDLEYRFLRPDGSICWVYGRAIALTDPTGHISGYTGSITDITQQKSQQAALDRAHLLLNSSQQLATIGSWELDLTTNTLTWSDETFRMFEVDQNKFDATYEAFLNTIHPDDREQVNTAYSNSLVDRKPYEITHRLKLKDGSIRWVTERCVSYFADDGAPLRSVGTVQDITERVDAMAALQESERRLKTVNDSLEQRVQERTKQLQDAHRIAQLGHWHANLQTGALYWSDQIYRIFGRNPAHFQPSIENFYACVHPDDLAAVKTSESHAFEVDGHHSVDHRVLHPDGTIRWVHEEAELTRDEHGVPWRLTGTVQDISQRKESEQLLIQAKEQAEQASRAKNDFLSRMSHELRTPMNAILGFTQILQLQPLPDEQRDSVEEIHKAGEHLLELINELLDLSQIEAGRLLTVIRPVEPSKMVSEAIQIMLPQADSRHITVSNCYHGTHSVAADPKHLLQILLNFLSNAIKYNRLNGRIIIDGGVSAPGLLRLSVTDTGHGIAPELQSQLFQPFERLGAEFTAVQGTGIGLSLCRQFASKMGGRVGAESSPGHGSTFWIELPLTEASATENPDPAITPPQPVAKNQFRILYIEDNLANLKVIEAMFRSLPEMQLITAGNGEFGLELARKYLPDIILLDIHLPGMDGFAVLKALQEDMHTRHVPVVALSADAMLLDIERGIKAGFADYLTKPIKLATLRQTLRQLLDNQSSASA